MTNTHKKLISHGSIYLAGNLMRHAVSFVMLPIYTRMLTPADYGTIELLGMVLDFTGIIFGLRIGEAIFRFYNMADDALSKKQLISTALLFTSLLNALGFLALYGGSGTICTVIFGGLEQQKLLILFSISLLFHPIIEIPMTYIRAQQRPWLFVSFSTIKLFLQLSLNIYLVVVLGLGVKGVVLSAVIAGGFMSLLLGCYCLSKTGIHFSTQQAKTLVNFSYPLILASIISFYVTFGDRYFIQLYGTLSDVGIYALSYKFGFLLTFIATGPFFSIWDSERYKVLKRPDAKETFKHVFIFFSGFSLLIVVVIAIFSKNIIVIMANPEFWRASEIVPILLLAYYFQGLTAFCNLGILLNNKTLIITKSIIISAVIITALYFLLIPRFGVHGAAWATLIAFVFRFIYIHWQAKKLYDMQLPWGRLVKLFPLCIVTILFSYFGPSNIIYSLLMNVSLILILFYTVTIIPIFYSNQQIVLRNFITKPWQLVAIIREIQNAPNK